MPSSPAQKETIKEYKRLEALRESGREENPIFLPKSLFDSYEVRSDAGGISALNIQTLGGAEKRAKELMRKYPCVGFGIYSKKHNSLIESYKPTVTGAGTPRVDVDNKKQYTQQATKEAKAAVRFTLYLDGAEYATYDTRAEAAAVGSQEGKGKNVRIKETHENPRLTFHWVSVSSPTVRPFGSTFILRQIRRLRLSNLQVMDLKLFDVTGRRQTYGSVVLAKQWIHNNLLERRKEHYYMGREGGRLGNPVAFNRDTMSAYGTVMNPLPVRIPSLPDWHISVIEQKGLIGFRWARRPVRHHIRCGCVMGASTGHYDVQSIDYRRKCVIAVSAWLRTGTGLRFAAHYSSKGTTCDPVPESNPCVSSPKGSKTNCFEVPAGWDIG